MELLLEANSGIAGDMTIAALVDLGVDAKVLEAELRKLPLSEAWTMEVKRVTRHGIAANHVTFLVAGKPIEGPYLSSDELAHKHSHGHGHDHTHDHAHSHGHGHGHTHEHHSPQGGPGGEPHGHEHTHGRRFADIRALIEASGLSAGAKRRALAIFHAIGVAEAKLHGVALDEVHFHEVGSLDAILDICGTAICLDLLGVTKLFCLPLPVGQGNAKMAHGTLPLPAPATMEILKGIPLRRVPYRFETVTPTGAAIVAALVSPEIPAAYSVEGIGYGAGTKDPTEVANFLRVYSIRSAVRAGAETIEVLETTVDDATGEWTAHLMQKLREAGALDVFAAPVQMKKGRLGTNVTVLAESRHADRLSEVCFLESTTIGVRRRTESRWALPRRAARVKTPWGEVAVKVVTLPGGHERATPEYDSCASVAAAAGAPLLEVYRAAAAQTEFIG